MNYQQLFEQAGLVQFKEVDIKGLGTIRIKKRTAADVLAKEKLLFEAQNNKQTIEPLRLAMLEAKLCVVDENGKPFLTDGMLQMQSSEVIYAIYAQINEFNSTITAEAVDDAAKKS